MASALDRANWIRISSLVHQPGETSKCGPEKIKMCVSLWCLEGRAVLLWAAAAGDPGVSWLGRDDVPWSCRTERLPAGRDSGMPLVLQPWVMWLEILDWGSQERHSPVQVLPFIRSWRPLSGPLSSGKEHNEMRPLRWLSKRHLRREHLPEPEVTTKGTGSPS